jgi:hypothetical protein
MLATNNGTHQRAIHLPITAQQSSTGTKPQLHASILSADDLSPKSPDARHGTIATTARPASGIK